MSRELDGVRRGYEEAKKSINNEIESARQRRMDDLERTMGAFRSVLEARRAHTRGCQAVLENHRKWMHDPSLTKEEVRGRLLNFSA